MEKKSLCILCLRQLFTQGPHLLTDVPVIHQFLFPDGLIMGQMVKAVDGKRLHPGKIVMEQLPEHFKIMFYKDIDRSVLGSHLFTYQAEGILTGDQKKGQVILPEVFIKGIISGYRKEVFHLAEYPGAQHVPVLAPVF